MVTINIPFHDLGPNTKNEDGITESKPNYKLYYLGAVDMNSVESMIIQQADEDVICVEQENKNHTNFVRSIEQRIIEKIEHAQLIGALSGRPSLSLDDPGEDGEITIEVGSTGVKLVYTHTGRVVERLALHKIMQAIAYEDADVLHGEPPASNVILVVKRKNFSNKGGDQCHLLQATSIDGATHVCRQLDKAFEKILADVRPDSSNNILNFQQDYHP